MFYLEKKKINANIIVQVILSWINADIYKYILSNKKSGLFEPMFFF